MPEDIDRKLSDLVSQMSDLYRQDVREMANDIQSNLADGTIEDREALIDYIHETVDGNRWVFLTFRAAIVALVTDNPDAHEDMGGETTVEQRAYCSMERDLYDALHRNGVDVNEPYTCETCDTSHESYSEAQECCPEEEDGEDA